ncbi:SRPBCC family protein [Winogradskyella endarachnes]|uniref:SRPBCC family protein n=1 Tax=Winogradskyella endarachnes TaxID=2681965 RepID=A0A6L6UC06_9FLAO|nr:SRPBCC family protein [Winogradskyella endarachnes]MUU79778.1 SRPBCC family protein [Winogradskyella endarachnes]
MQYVTEVLIKKSISEVIEKLDSIDNLKHWQEGLVSTEHISGVPSELGSIMRLRYSFGKRKMEIIETVTKQNFPNEFHASYTTKGMRNIQENYFKSTQENYTKWTSKNEFQPTSFKMSAMLFLMPTAFKKQTETYLNNFKNFVENGISVSTSV